MCILLDANVLSDYLKKTRDMVPVREWVDKKGGKIAYSPTDDLRRELKHNHQMREKFKGYMREGKLKVIDKKAVLREQKRIQRKHDLTSNDPHILALAKIGHVQVLVSQDQKLGNDFSSICGGKIYKRKNHKHLLQNLRCP